MVMIMGNLDWANNKAAWQRKRFLKYGRGPMTSLTRYGNRVAWSNYLRRHYRKVMGRRFRRGFRRGTHRNRYVLRYVKKGDYTPAGWYPRRNYLTYGGRKLDWRIRSGVY